MSTLSKATGAIDVMTHREKLNSLLPAASKRRTRLVRWGQSIS